MKEEKASSYYTSKTLTSIDPMFDKSQNHKQQHTNHEVVIRLAQDHFCARQH